MASSLAFVFPGQGAQAVGMGQDLYNSFATARKLFREADEVLGFSLSKLCFEGPEEELRRTINAQPAILTVSLACLEAAREANPTFRELEPAFVAGHSLGEYTALAVAGVLDLPQLLLLVRERGRLMEEAGTKNPGGMAAIIGLEEPEVGEICREAQVEIANINSPGQITISGPKEAIAKSMDLARERGAKRVVPLDVSGAFHSRLMEPARQGLAEMVRSMNFRKAQMPVVANSTAQPIVAPDAIREELIGQLCSPVRWRHSVEFMYDAGVKTFVEIGPGKVLTGLIRRISEDATTINLGDASSIREEAARAL